ncbi:hypothetical protein C8Q76DRAFT_91435 [Earliella scabrosa]|nr:hypothetical protein C8Q76DRAFT_91435 [Earliella scabrosa]
MLHSMYHLRYSLHLATAVLHHNITNITSVKVVSTDLNSVPRRLSPHKYISRVRSRPPHSAFVDCATVTSFWIHHDDAARSLLCRLCFLH